MSARSWDTVTALILHNLFGRFPDVRVISVENGAFWVAYAVKLMNKNYAINQTVLAGRPAREAELGVPKAHQRDALPRGRCPAAH